MSSSPAGSTTPFSDYTSSRSQRGLTIVDDNRVIEVYILKHTTDPILVLVPIARAETYSAFWNIIKNDLYPKSNNVGDEAEITPMIFLLDPYMTLLRLELWSDLVPTLRGKRVLVLPGDAAPPPLSDGTKALLPQHKKNTWSNLTQKSSPIIPETSLVTVDAQTQRLSPEPRKNWTKPIPDSSPLSLETNLPYPPTNPPYPITTMPYPSTSPSRPATAEQKPRPKVKIEDRSVSFFKTPEFAFDLALWCRFAPSYKPSLLMHFQFREVVIQVVPTARGLSVRNMTSKISSALTNMLRRQGCLGTLTSSPMSDFRDLLVKPEFLRFALEDWPSSKESLGLTAETLRWLQEPVLLYCEIQDVHFPQKHDKNERPGRRPAVRKVEIESASEEELE